MKIEKMTKKALVAAMVEECVGDVNAFVDGKEIVRTPNVFGIGKTPAGNYMVYFTNEAGKLHHTSVHKTRQEANGMMLRRLRAAQVEA